MSILHKHVPSFIENDILVINTQPFYSELLNFLTNYTKYIRKKNSLENTQYNLLPFVYNTDIESELKFRRKSHSIVKQLLSGKKGLRVLEISPWNAWLTPLLCENNNSVVAIDYFDDEVNGLQTKKHHSHPKWTAIQCDLENPEFFDCEFDLIVFNHNIQFFVNPIETIKKYSKLLSKNGQIILLGLGIFKNHGHKEKQVETLKKQYQTQHGVNLFFRPCKGYLNSVDKTSLQKQGFVFQRYPVNLFKRLIPLFLPHKPKFYFAYFEKQSESL